jgi:uncharacterized protein with PhoU and TrkA domain
MEELEEELLEAKDTSELMVDLAYSSLLYSNRDIAEEVKEMEEMVKELTASIQQQAIRRTQSDGDVARAYSTIKLAQSLEVIADAASSIADVVRRNVEPHPVIKMSLADSDVIITTVKVTEDAPLANHTLGDLQLATHSGMWVIAIRRDRHYIYGPDEKTTVLPGDTLIARGPEEGERRLREFATGGAEEEEEEE